MSKNTLPSGLMIQDTSKERTTKDKIVAACNSYHKKFGRWPRMIWGSVADLNSFNSSENGVMIIVSPFLQKNHFLVGPLPAEN